MDPIVTLLAAAGGETSGGLDGPGVLAVIGAATGVVALLWNIGRALREGERLDVQFYVFAEDAQAHRGPHALIDVVNVGSRTAYFSGVFTVDDIPWTRRWPVVRSLTFRTRRRWWIRWWLNRTPHVWMVNLPKDRVPESLEPGESRRMRVLGDSDDSAVEEMVKTGTWAIVETGVRPYATRIVDNRVS